MPAVQIQTRSSSVTSWPKTKATPSQFGQLKLRRREGLKEVPLVVQICLIFHEPKKAQKKETKQLPSTPQLRFMALQTQRLQFLTFPVGIHQ